MADKSKPPEPRAEPARTRRDITRDDPRYIIDNAKPIISEAVQPPPPPPPAPEPKKGG